MSYWMWWSDFLFIFVCSDTPEVDIVGTNLYQRYVTRLHKRKDGEINNGDKDSKQADSYDPELPESRNVPTGSNFNTQTVTQSMGVLVCTGVYKPGVEKDMEGDEKNYHGHRDFPYNAKLYKPTKTVEDVDDAVRYILEREGITNL